MCILPTLHVLELKLVGSLPHGSERKKKDRKKEKKDKKDKKDKREKKDKKEKKVASMHLGIIFMAAQELL